MRLKTIGYALLIVMALASIAFAAAGDSDFKFRYSGLVSTTPIADVNQLNGVTSNVQTQLDAGGTGTLADTFVFVGNGSNVATGVALTVSGDATGTGDNTGDIAITLAADSVSAGQLGVINVVTMTMTTGSAGGEVAVETGSLLLDVQAVSGFSNDVTLTKGIYVDPTLIINTDAHAGTVIINAIFLRP